MQIFRKEVLRPGTHRTGDGLVEFSADDVKAVYEGTAKLFSNGLHTPLLWEHSNKKKPAEPYAPGDEKRARTKFTAGFSDPETGFPELVGDRLFMSFAVPDTKDAEKILDRRIRKVSPEVRANYIDGAGREYGPCITAVALTHNPAIEPQSGFVPVSMKKAGPLIACSIDSDEDEVIQFSSGPATEKQDKVDGTGGQGPSDQIAGEQKPDMPPVKDMTMQSLVAYLDELGLSLPQDTDRESLPERLLVAAKTALKQKQLLEQENQQEEANLSDTDSPMPPAFSQMSAETVKKQQAAFTRITKFAEARKLTPGMADKYRSRLAMLSTLDSDEKVQIHLSLIDEQLDELENAKQVNFLSGPEPEMTRFSAPDHPGGDGFLNGEETIEFGDPRGSKLADSFLRRTGFHRHQRIGVSEGPEDLLRSLLASVGH